MHTLPNIENIEQLCENEHSFTIRCIDKTTKTPHIYKVLKKEYLATPFSEELKKEFELNRSFKSDMIIEMLEYRLVDACPVILIEDFDGYPLLQVPELENFSLEKQLRLAILLTSALEDIHRENVAFCNLNPDHMLYNPMTRQLKITDLSLAQRLPIVKLGNFSLPIPVSLLPYISPEQTGRLNRDIDHRSDFYSLGIILYQLFSGQLPFSATEPTEYIHLHIAKEPPPPHTVNRAVPRQISKILHKLLNKTTENRYQSCKGIRHDLEVCLHNIKEFGAIKDFNIGEKDVAEIFKLSEKLYGRDKEKALILKEFNSIQGQQSRMLFVSGTSGIGKSSLVNNLRKPVAQQHGYFLSGKFDQVQSDVPYMPIIISFQGLVNQILAEGEAAVQRWKTKILENIGDHGKIIIDVIPEVEFIIGKQPALPELAPHENENRFSRIFSEFIHACSSKDRPLVIFLDDMQWSDSATLRFIEHFLIKQKTEGILILGTYRSNQVSDTHPLNLTINRILQSDLDLPIIELPPLRTKDIQNLISDSLFESRENFISLATICLEKTDGNPFFVKQFLRAAHHEHHITYNANKGTWQWDEKAISLMEITDNLLHLQIKNLRSLHHDTLRTLKYAACLGNSFDLNTLATVCQQSTEQTIESLEKLSEIIITVDRTTSISPLIDTAIHQTAPTYRFSHDQLQRVAYSLLSPPERKKIHLSVGMRLKSMGSHSSGFSHVFDITGHLNIGADLIDSFDEKIHLAKLNLLAGKKALSSAASLSASNYLQAGLKILPPKSWQENYELTLSLHVEAAEAAYLSSNFEEAERLFDIIISKSRTLLDQAKAYSIQIRALKARNMSAEAIETGVVILRKFGVKINTNPGKLYILLSFLSTRKLLSKKTGDEIIGLPTLSDPHVSAIMSFLYDIGTASYYVNTSIMPLLSTNAISLSLINGNSSESSIIGYPTYGFIECGIPFGSIEKGYRIGQISLALLKKNTTNRPHPQTLYLVNNLIIHWKEHLKNTLPAMAKAYTDCLEAGDFEIAANSAYGYSYRLFLTGHNLEKTKEKMAGYRDIIERLGHKIPLYRHRLFQQTVENLLRVDSDPTKLLGKYYFEDIMVPIHKGASDNTTIFLVYFNKLLQSYLFKHYEKAHEYARSAHKLIDSVTSSAFVPVFFFYYALTLLALYKESSSIQKIHFRLQIFFFIKKFKRWAKHCPENYLHKLNLIIAEKARIDEQHDRALRYYDQAILAAEKNDYTQELALAHELTSSFFLSQNRQTLALPHMQSALHFYTKWGAVAKVDRMKKEYSNLYLPAGDDEIDMASDSSMTQSSQQINSNLDAAAVIKATRTLTGKIFEDDFLKNLMEIMLENAGAQRGFLLFEADNGWQVRLQGTLSDSGVKIRTLSPHKISKKISLNIVNYVARTKDSVVLNNASSEGLFTQDKYVLKNKPKSILCTPVIHQRKISCIVYLENNLTFGAFSPERQEILHLLGSHAAISMKNSNLYSELERTVEKLHIEIKKRKETQLQLLHAEKLAALGRLSSSIAHEFGNPLTGIRYLLQDILQRFSLSLEDKRLLEIGVDECQRMKVLIRDMQQLNRPSTGIKKIFTPHKTLENVLLFQKKNLKNNNINVVRKYGSNITGILAVEDQITQVLVNITLNAVDAMSEKGGTLTIITSQDAEYLNIVIKDTGVGISPENQENVFEPFFSTKATVEGTGLGLPVSYSIVKNHGGNITFTSTLGVGSAFHTRLPNKPPKNELLT